MRSVLVVIAPPRVAHSGLCKIPESSRFQWSCLVVVPLTSCVQLPVRSRFRSPRIPSAAAWVWVLSSLVGTLPW